MSKLIQKKSFSSQLLLKVNRSKTWGATISIVDNWTDKKIAYAGGCGYDKQAGALSDLVWNHFENNPYTYLLRERIESGMFTSPWDHIKESSLSDFFNYIGLSVSVNKLDKGKYPIYKINKDFTLDKKDLKEIETIFISNNQERYNEIVKKFDEVDKILKQYK